MKKLLSMILAALTALCVFSCAFASELDLDFVRENSDLFTLDVNTEKDVAFVESNLTAKERSFVHKYESSTRYSNTKFDIIIIDYIEQESYPVYRLWITYCADDAYLNIDSVTFEIGDTNYTFSDIADYDWYTEDENGFVEKVMIKFDIENLLFLAELEGMLPETYEEMKQLCIKMTLNGREKIEIELGEGFFTDFLLTKTAFTRCGGLDYLDTIEGSPMKVKTAE